MTLRPETEDVGIVFADQTAASGIEYRHSAYWIDSVLPKEFEHVAPWFKASGVQVAVTDFNGDRFPDIFVTGAEPGRRHKLFLNRRDGTFLDIGPTAFPMSVNDGYLSHKPVFFDCNRDGFQDLLVITNNCPRLFVNEQGRRFVDFTSEAGLKSCHGHHGNVTDLDGDGNLDVIYATYEFGSPPRLDHLFLASIHNQKVSVYRNEGQCRFSERVDTGISRIGYTHAIGIADIRGIGRRDLWFVTDYGPDRVFLDNGDGTYENVSGLLKNSFSRTGMAFDVLYEGPDGPPLVYVSHIYEPPYVVGGNTLWNWRDGKLVNLAPERGVARCGHAWGGKFLDWDLDGDEDLAVTNGYFSGDKKKNTEFSLASLSATIRPVMGDFLKWPKMTGATHFGYEKNCLFVNKGGRFATAQSQDDPFLQDVLDGRGLAVLDILRDGRPTLLVGNQLQHLKLFTALAPARNASWVGFNLEGRCSNRDGYGAKITVHAYDRSLTRYYYPTNGFAAQSDPAVLVGLGELEAAAVSATVVWPSGHTEKISGLRINTYHHLVEGRDCAFHQAMARAN